MDAEILVHISVPTTFQDDEKCRTRADAYLDFEPHRPDASTDVVASNVCRVVSVEHEAATTTEDSYSSFPSTTLVVEEDGRGVTLPSWAYSDGEDRPPPRNRLEQLELIHSRWNSSAPKSSAGNEKSSFGEESPLYIEDAQLAAQALESQLFDDLSEISFQSNWDATTLARVDTMSEDVDVSGRNSSTPSIEHLSSTALEDIPGSVGCPESALDQLPPVNGNHIASAGSPFRRPLLMHSHSAPVGSTWSVCETHDEVWDPSTPNPESQQSQYGDREIHGLSKDLKHDDPFGFRSLPYDVLAPSPGVSIETPAKLPSQITRDMDSVLQNNKGKFRPLNQHRLLDPDERGCWIVNTSGWTHLSQLEFWSSLSDHIRQGTLGWGVTLHREHTNTGETDPAGMSVGVVRLYCWGEIAEHVWIYIWLCSNGLVIGSESHWVDADEVVVLQMA